MRPPSGHPHVLHIAGRYFAYVNSHFGPAFQSGRFISQPFRTEAGANLFIAYDDAKKDALAEAASQEWLDRFNDRSLP